MELLRANFVNTTTAISVINNTASASNLLNSDTRFQYFTDQMNDDATTAAITISFTQTTTVDRIALVNHNWKAFTIFYNGSTANTLNLTATSNTTTSDYSSNSDTSHYFRFAPINAVTISIHAKSTIVANQNKYLGYVVVSEKLTNFGGRIPSANRYQPVLDSQGVVHRLSDGGTRIQTIEDKWSVNMAFDYLTEDVRDELKEIFDDHEELVFAPFGTTTGWDAVIFPCVWEGGFEFFRYSDNASEAGFSGGIKLRETPF